MFDFMKPENMMKGYYKPVEVPQTIDHIIENTIRLL